MHVEIVPVTPLQQNCSVVWDDEKNAAIIDPGGESIKLIRFIEENQLKLVSILLTHGHHDHVGAAMKLKEHFNIEILGPEASDQYWFEALPQQSERFGLQLVDVFLPDHWLNDGDKVEVGSLSFDVIHLPGHTPGHIAFVNQKENIIFSGDVLFKGGVGRSDFPGGDHKQLINSIKIKMFCLNDEMIVVPGHGPLTTIADEKVSNPYLQG